MADNDLPRIVTTAPDDLALAARALRDGAIVAVPTETVYGLAARADSVDAVAAIYRAKGRPDFNPLIVHVPDLAGAEALAVLDDRARGLAAAFWPGPLTMVLPRRDDAPLAAAVTAGLPTVAIRCPAHPVMQAILRESGLPLAAPSANRSGGVSPTTAGHVAASLGGRVPVIVDGGACKAGIESTIVALRDDGGWQVLRPGPITSADLAAVLGQGEAHEDRGIEAPGQMTSHYAPGKPVRLNAAEKAADEFYISFGTEEGDSVLSRSGDLAEAAARLYAALHEAAHAPQPKVAIAPIPDKGIGAAINDRLRRAAAPI
ncbi:MULTISPECIES: L-threonylcarbamoyladenylate synthase [unclassified Novosphingobium]|uniref:L-threonylcarbamoyladenylate synthase n=1 Tax=unclassified Novosphingobium TaxID=2644732 RepID=UPI00086AD12C|nr:MULTISPECIES: L-threonylcarbamoyladenylate synthase [unclassified Novosphingobium]MBN9142662.1 threonylcarbamoyl-AMP synthase [Novosphingobium sp.]MDR6705745.1 L-threonylcarbamoyladenylate synthase [Novosphingobium sp. 1748]ODU80386.1 MAG: threonylcarbamoyl-AMP synthase [Novosphingobium sp. SCN 63-17]OJX89072.1 MAG: threonylcarbamoyl-AMP synthase [Novosphingobium sp. 63-713]